MATALVGAAFGWGTLRARLRKRPGIALPVLPHRGDGRWRRANARRSRNDHVELTLLGRPLVERDHGPRVVTVRRCARALSRVVDAVARLAVRVLGEPVRPAFPALPL